jgi:hypothetical protein
MIRNRRWYDHHSGRDRELGNPDVEIPRQKIDLIAQRQEVGIPNRITRPFDWLQLE